MIRKLLVLSLVLVASLATVANAQTTAQLHGDPGCAPSPFDGILWGGNLVCYVQAGTYNGGSVYLQDANGGIGFYDAASAGIVNVGDLVQVTGTVAAFGAEIQLNGATYTVLSSGNTPTPVNIGTGDLNDGTDQLGNFMQVEGVFTSVSTGGFNETWSIDDGTGACIVFIDGTTGINMAALSALEGNWVSVRGSTKCYNAIGEILPRNDNDFTLITVATDEVSMGVVKSRF